MNSTKLPLMVIFTLDYNLVLYFVDFIIHPLSKTDGELFDSDGDILKCSPEAVAVFKKLKEANIKIAIYQYTQFENETNELIKAYGWDEYISYKEYYDIDGGSVNAFTELQKKSTIPFNQTILFYNNAIKEKIIEKFDFYKVNVGRYGITVKILDDTLKAYNEWKQR